MSRRKSNKHRSAIDLLGLPTWLQYVFAICVVALLAGSGWFAGRNDPVPAWLEDYVIPVLGWLGLLLIAIVLGDWVKKRHRR